ncbi:hypothetical protein O181_020488 [Austropuccinia psidii MF-1]|uniref:Uncharacterized protein n=1 Tax=Austropuccinia psidii MF-1 TaxID=1389203 RepID=A0A9Q3GUJ9_9BASI|nr:hypothetical protein [Austropuccinia psidii MF-1]
MPSISQMIQSFSKWFPGRQRALIASKKSLAVDRKGMTPMHRANLCGMDTLIKWQMALFSSGNQLSIEDGESSINISVLRESQRTLLRQVNHSAKFDPLLLSGAKRLAVREFNIKYISLFDNSFGSASSLAAFFAWVEADILKTAYCWSLVEARLLT